METCVVQQQRHWGKLLTLVSLVFSSECYETTGMAMCAVLLPKHLGISAILALLCH